MSDMRVWVMVFYEALTRTLTRTLTPT